MRIPAVFSAGLLGLTVASLGGSAQAQFQPPANTLAFDDTGSVELIESGLIRIRDEKNESWVLKIDPESKVTIEGEAQVECLRPGLYVQLTGEIDKKGTLKEPVEEIQIFSTLAKGSLGLFSAEESAEDDSAGAKPVRNAGAGSFRIRGKVAFYRDGELMVVAGNRKINGTLADEVTVKLNSDDLSLAQPGDKVKVKAWYHEMQRPNPLMNRPGAALVQEITVTLEKPLAPTAKRSRAGAEKPERPAAKTKRLSK